MKRRRSLSEQVAAAINAAMREQAREDCWRFYKLGWFWFEDGLSDASWRWADDRAER